jgi:hypothetical protein
MFILSKLAATDRRPWLIHIVSEDGTCTFYVHLLTGPQATSTLEIYNSLARRKAADFYEQARVMQHRPIHLQYIFLWYRRSLEPCPT